MPSPFIVHDRLIGPGEPCYIIAEMSANHGHDINEAKRLFEAAKESGADAIKLQTYTADTMTIACDAEPFRLGTETIWNGRVLHELYQEAHTPWEWHGELSELAKELEMDFFSTPFDSSAIALLEELEVPLYKIASFEMVHLPLIKEIASKGKPIIMSTGMATLSEIDDAVRTIRENGNPPLALLKCTSAYPAPACEANLRTIPHLAQAFDVITGLSDHTLGTAVPVAAVALGACIIEKHFIRDRSVGGPDSSFSLEPAEFKQMVDAVRAAEQALGRVTYDVTSKQESSKNYRRSLFVVKDIAAGEAFTAENIRIIRPGQGLAPKHFDQILAHNARCDLKRGTPLSWEHVG